jgi:hypothetical protein
VEVTNLHTTISPLVVTARIASVIGFVLIVICILLVIIQGIVEFEYRWRVLLTTGLCYPPGRVGEDDVAALGLEWRSGCTAL